MERSEIQDDIPHAEASGVGQLPPPDFAPLHPGYSFTPGSDARSS